MKRFYIIFVFASFCCFISCKQEGKIVEKETLSTDAQPLQSQGQTNNQEPVYNEDSEQQNVSNSVSINQAIEFYKTGNYTFIDLRTDEEIAESGMVPGAIQLNMRDVNFKKDFDALDKDAGYVVYCQSGGRSKRAFSMAMYMGFTNLHDMSNGFPAWKEKYNEN